MPKNIIVPLDRSDVAERALPVAVTLARQLEARLYLISVLEVSPDAADRFAEQAPDEPLNEPLRSALEDVEAYLGNIASGLDTAVAATQVLIGADPAVEIDATVLELDDALLVMTGHGRSGIRRLVLGSTTTRLVQLASYPLIVVPAECNVFGYPESISRVLLAMDGSSFAEYAQEVTLDVFPADDLSLHLLRVVDPVEAVDTDIRGRASDYLGKIADNLSARGRTVTWTVDVAYSADIANRIVINAHVTECDLIALATHGRTGFSRWYYGSVADGVLRSATKPVMIIHPSEEVIARAPESRSRRVRQR
ncbi:MAG: universal stress protein [Thermomicrobiales bacterium]